MAARTTRQLHPCVSIENRKGGVDFCTWLTLKGTQHLATAHCSVLNIYSVILVRQQQQQSDPQPSPPPPPPPQPKDQYQYQLQLEHSVVLHGSIISLHTVPNPTATTAANNSRRRSSHPVDQCDDLLLLGFTSRCVSLVEINYESNLCSPLRVLSMLEFNHLDVVLENSSSAFAANANSMMTATATTMGDDLQVEIYTDAAQRTTIAVLAGAELYLSHTVVVAHHHHQKSSSSAAATASSATSSAQISLSDVTVLSTAEHGTILAHSMLASDTIVLLHRSAHHHVMVTAISDQHDVILWSHHVPSDALQLSISPPSSGAGGAGGDGGQILVIGANTVTKVQDQGIDHVLPVNGFANTFGHAPPPGPHIPLSITLDGCCWVWRKQHHKYNNQHHPNNDDDNAAIVILRRGNVLLYAQDRLWDTGRTIHCPEVSSAIGRPTRASNNNNHTDQTQSSDQDSSLHLLLFVGSRLSDGLLLTLDLLDRAVPKLLRPADPVQEIKYEFSQEERDLYHIVSDDDDDDDDADGTLEKRPITTMPILHHITLQDRLVSLAPISTSAAATVCAVGYGAAGGLGHLHTAGTYGIRTQLDLANVEYVGRIYEKTIVLGIKDRGVHILDGDSGREVSMEQQQQQPNDLLLLNDAKVLMAGGDGILVVRNEIDYTVVALDRSGRVQCRWPLQHVASNVISLTCLLPNAIFACLEESGAVSLINVRDMSATKAPEVSFLPDALPMDIESEALDDDDKELSEFHADPKVTAVAIFVAPKSWFATNSDELDKTTKLERTEGNDIDQSNDAGYDAEEQMLYAEVTRTSRSDDPTFHTVDNNNTNNYKERPSLQDEAVYCAVCRQNGTMDVYEVVGTGNPVHRWRAHGIAFGCDKLVPSGTIVSSTRRLPQTQKVYARELCYFKHEHIQGNGMVLSSKSFFAVESSNGDIYLYRLQEKSSVLLKQPFHVASRQSKEQGRHRAKLVRKGAVPKGIDDDPFQYRSFYPFAKISHQSGLFVSASRPFWVLSDKGHVTVLEHRPLHAAPAGGKQRPVAGFCDLGDSSFVIVHERVGRVGTQRLTLFGDIVKPNCVLVGNVAVEKFPLGVTVRKIVALLDNESSNHALYALLVSRETMVDQSDLNSDGLTDEERERMKKEKETIRMKKQVEADLGGFDMESEWVEEIEREDCIQVNTSYGGAPPIPQPAYSIWIVDASNSFRVVDSYQLEDYEHGIDLKAMSLTDFSGFDDKDDSEITEETKPQVPFIVVGTGIVSRNGEDVAAKGRALLFRVQRTKEAHVAELSLVYQKNIFHGPVSTVSCLSADGKNRLVIGAGADVNVEQWGNERLTQVGFFRATMHISKIQHFKTFLLLSDAYDSVYFLVWRESDKSLTLLAKDYDPIIVYAAGVLARGAALSLCVHDERENLQFFQYAPAEAAARGGNKLVCRADFHLGETTVNLSSTHCCRSPLLVHSATPVSTQAALKQQDPLFGRQDDDHRVAIHFGTADGSFGSIVAVSEPVFWRLMALQSVMANALEFDAGLNPRLWRLYQRSNRGCRSNDRKKGVIDGNLIFRYAYLSFPEQEDLASSIGTTVDLIMDNLVDIQCANKIV